MSQPNTATNLTKNQALVFNALKTAEGPLSAYALLDRLRDDGFRAPPQVYRALERLIELGFAHKLESLNAFVVCSHPACDGHETIAFTICEDCGSVSELSNDAVTAQLDAIASDHGFAVKRSVIELRGACRECAD